VRLFIIVAAVASQCFYAAVMCEVSFCFWASHDLDDVQLKTLLKSMKSMEHVLNLFMTVAVFSACMSSLASFEFPSCHVLFMIVMMNI
jgi:hypothetical protein